MKENFVVKHKLTGALFLGVMVLASLMIAFAVLKSLEVPYVKEIPTIPMLVIILCIGIYIVWSNYCLRKIIIESETCTYINLIGRRKSLPIENIGKIMSDGFTVDIYDNSGNKFCIIEAFMTNLDKLRDCTPHEPKEHIELDKLEEAVQQHLSDFMNLWKDFLSDKNKLGITIEYGLHVMERETGIIYHLAFRAKKDGEYLRANFLKLGIWGDRVLFLGYNKKTGELLVQEENEVSNYMEDLYRKLNRIKNKGTIKRKMNLAPLVMKGEMDV